MNQFSHHHFHIPVMGIGFTIDTPFKVAPYGIDSVISIVDDILLEQMREFYCGQLDREFTPISNRSEDYRAKRITAYLNLIQEMAEEKFEGFKKETFSPGSNLTKYFEMLPDHSSLKILYQNFLAEENQQKRDALEVQLRNEMKFGSIDVNIMAKLDNVNYNKAGEALPDIYNDAMAALRGYALSNLSSAVILSAGLNPKLYAYFEEFEDFYPNGNQLPKKRIILKVSDYRSAYIQGRMLAKRGLWVSEFRIESGLNCGGHAFATEGKLMGPILEELKSKREALGDELWSICNEALSQRGASIYVEKPKFKITAQGGIGTANESEFLMAHYELDSTGWGSPFLLVPEATNLDEETLNQLAQAQKEDYYLSDASPLGVPINNFRNTSSQKLLKSRIDKNRPGSPCVKKYLEFNQEFTEKNICTASRQYQDLKLKELKETAKSEAEYEEQSQKILEKECLCEGLAIPAVIVNNAQKPKQRTAVSICPGPNLAYFSGTFLLKEMIDHIYGRRKVLNSLNREHMFVNELELYVSYLKKEIQKNMGQLNQKQVKYFDNFRNSLLEGVDYYKSLFGLMKMETEDFKNKSLKVLASWECQLKEIKISVSPLVEV